jgi:hypothetical protein
LGFLAELELKRGSFELMDVRPGMEPLEFDLLNHFVGFVKNCVKPVDGDADRGMLPVPEPGERCPGGRPASGGLNISNEGAPLRVGIGMKERRGN